MEDNMDNKNEVLEKVRYSDEELQEFKDIILKNLKRPARIMNSSARPLPMMPATTRRILLPHSRSSRGCFGPFQGRVGTAGPEAAQIHTFTGGGSGED